MPTFEEQLADRTPWTLADIARELSMMPLIVAEHAHRALHDQPDTQRSFPAPLPGSGAGWPLVSLFGIAAGRVSGDGGPVWAAGDIRLWALHCARMDRNFNLIKAKPPIRRHPRSS